jgi:hypothetical protein
VCSCASVLYICSCCARDKFSCRGQKAIDNSSMLSVYLKNCNDIAIIQDLLQLFMYFGHHFEDFLTHGNQFVKPFILNPLLKFVKKNWTPDDH